MSSRSPEGSRSSKGFKSFASRVGTKIKKAFQPLTLEERNEKDTKKVSEWVESHPLRKIYSYPAGDVKKDEDYNATVRLERRKLRTLRNNPTMTIRKFNQIYEEEEEENARKENALREEAIRENYREAMEQRRMNQFDDMSFANFQSRRAMHAVPKRRIRSQHALKKRVSLKRVPGIKGSKVKKPRSQYAKKKRV